MRRAFRLRLPASLALAWCIVGGPGTAAYPVRAQETEPDQELIERGRMVYTIYCGNCHGPSGRGDGPTGRILEVKPSDLTKLSDGNDGEFPFGKVYRTIDGRETVRGHGDSRMPIWGLTFQELDADTNQEDQVRGKILQLIEYLKSIQGDAP